MYRADDRTLTDEDVKEPHERFVNSLCAGLAAEVRA
jgi:phenylalanyl-tRNA synthetase beta subunit